MQVPTKTPPTADRVGQVTPDRAKEAREAYRHAGIRAWNDYQTTGRHVTADEADAWLTKLEAGQDVEPPECHV